jgi:hypothetical protein
VTATADTAAANRGLREGCPAFRGRKLLSNGRTTAFCVV